MSQSLTWRLIRSNLYFARWLIVGSIVAGLLSLALLTRSPVSFFVGSVSLICTLIVLNIFLAVAVTTERKGGAHLFFLSLPISTTQYVLTKAIASCIAFVGPWLLLTAASVALAFATPIPDGIVPFAVTVLAYILAYYFVLLGVVLVKDSSVWTTSIVIIGNVSINFLIPYLLRLPSVDANVRTDTLVWSPEVVLILAAEIALGLVVLGLGFYFASKKKDFA